MFKKTVAGVVSSFTKNIQDLEDIAVKSMGNVTKIDEQLADMNTSREANRKEAELALSIAENIRVLISGK